jgi:hypothetical protein
MFNKVFVLDMNPVTKAVKEIESFYIDYYKEHWEKLLTLVDVLVIVLSRFLFKTVARFWTEQTNLVCQSRIM